MKNPVESLLVLLVFDRRNRLLVRINPEQCAEPTYTSKAGEACVFTEDCVESGNRCRRQSAFVESADGSEINHY